MDNLKVAKSGAKVGVYAGVGAAVEAFLIVVYPPVQTIFPNGTITVGVSMGIAAIVNYLKHRKPV